MVDRIAYLFKVSLEQLDDARDLVRHAMQRSKDWKALYGVASAAEAYAGRDTAIHLHLMLNLKPETSIYNRAHQDTDAVLRQWEDMPDRCIWIQRHPGIDGRRAKKARDSHRGHDRSKNSDEAMLIGIVQFLKKKKGAVPTPVPSLAWLKRLDTCSVLEFKRLDKRASIAPPATLRFTLRPIEPNGEAGLLTRGKGVLLDGQLADQQVEGGAQVVGDLSDNNAPLIGKGGRPTLNVERIVASLSIELGHNDTVGVSIEEPLNLILQSYDLSFRPLDLSAWPIEWMHGAHGSTLVAQSGTDSNAL